LPQGGVENAATTRIGAFLPVAPTSMVMAALSEVRRAKPN